MISRVTWKVIGLFLIAALSQYAVADEVGLTAGEFRVDESGGATYSIPLSIAPGIAGVAPAVSLNYSSGNTSEGPLGVGWSVGGLSSISRCPQTPFHDADNITGINLTSTDRFCLDGQRLILVSGTYGAPGSVYRKEVDDFSVITAKRGSTTNGPKYFEVVTKSNETWYYGDASDDEPTLGGADAFVEPGGGAAGVKAFRWAVKAIVDVKSNYILFNYDEDISEGTFYIDNIQYTGNLNLGKTPFAKVQFNYDDYDKGFQGYLAGAKFNADQILTRIDATVDNQAYRSYFLDYEMSGFIEERTLLESIQECTDASRNTCLPSTTFNWQRPALATGALVRRCESEPGFDDVCFFEPTIADFNAFDASNTQITNTSNRETSQVFDINGDGYHDLIYVEGSNWVVKFGPFFGTKQTLTNVGVGKKEYALNIDFNGDGVRDLMVADSTTSNWRVIYFHHASVPDLCPEDDVCSTFTSARTKTYKDLSITATGLENKTQIMDVNGDGLEDIVSYSSNSLVAYINNGNGSFTSKTLYTFTQSVNAVGLRDGYIGQTADIKSLSAMDINGDGRSDMIIKVTTGAEGCYKNGTLYAFYSTPYLCEAEFGGTWSTQTSTSHDLMVSSGTPDNPTLTSVATIGSINNTIRAVDLNGDGLTDIMFVVADKWHYRLSNGITLLPARDTGLTTSSTRKYLDQFVDLNGDGRTDILHAISNSQWEVNFSRPSSANEWVVFQDRGFESFDANATMRFGDTDGDGKTELLTSTGPNWVRYTKRKEIKEYVINTITNGFGVDTVITYAPMTDTSVYVTRASDNQIDNDAFSPLSGAQLVSSVKTLVNTGNYVEVQYQYGGLLVHKKGRGSLGFQMLRTTDLQTDVVTETQYSQDYSYTHYATTGMPVFTKQYRGNSTLSIAKNTLDTKQTATSAAINVYFPYIHKSTEQGFVYGSDTQSTKINEITTTNDYDTWGNLTKSNVNVYAESSGDSLITVTDNDYGTGNYERFGRLSTTKVTKSRTGRPDITRNSMFTYYPDLMLHQSITSPSPEAAKFRTTTTYYYDGFGNKTRESVAGYSTDTGSTQTRNAYTAFDTRGRYVKSSKNSLNHETVFKYNGMSADSVTGRITSTTVTDPNGISVTTNKDGFGRTTTIDYPDSRTGSVVTAFCSGCVTNSYFSETRTETGSPTTVTYFDRWGREVGKKVQNFAGGWNQTATYYDNQGRVDSVTEPVSGFSSVYDYDEIGRLKQEIKPSLAVNEIREVTIEYDGLATKHTNELGQVSIIYKNGFGETKETEDPLKGKVSFTYDAYGALLTSTVTDKDEELSSIITNVYDKWGRKTSTDDPVKGVWSYKYNAFGELYKQTNARGSTFTFTYDVLGRKTRSYEASEGTLCWKYGTAAPEKGKLIETTKYQGSNQNCDSPTVTASIKKEFEYNSLSQLEQVTTIIEGTSYKESTTYDSYSRPDEITYAYNDGTLTPLLTVKNVYNSYGYNSGLINADTGAIYKTVVSQNERGQTTSITYGNGTTGTFEFFDDTGWLDSVSYKKAGNILTSIGVTYDLLGNVKTRSSYYSTGPGAGSQFTETYDYDDLNRLENRVLGVTAYGSGLPAPFDMDYEYRYDSLGNLTFKTGTGYYKYDSEKAHQLEGIYDQYQNEQYSGQSYGMGYDGNGNLTSDGVNGRTFVYGSFDKPVVIRNGSNEARMRYGVNRELYYKQDKIVEGGSTTYYNNYYAGAIEKVARTGGNGALTEYKVNLGGIIVTKRSNSTSETNYLHTDHQGSVIAITNGSGSVIQQSIYDPFGKQSHIYQTSYLSNFTYSLPTEAGYTGHKQLKGLDIIHMNGRIYDPTLGRFLQADPHIQAPSNSQSYNRYSYVLNNPLSYTDPSGYFFKSLFKKLNKALGDFAPFVAAALMFIPGVGQWAAASMWNAAAVGFVSGGIATGSLKGALIGAFTGAAFQQIGAHYRGLSAQNVDNVAWGGGQLGDYVDFGGNLLTKGQVAGQIASHAVAGGVISTLGGGKFGHGFFSAGVTKSIGGAYLPGGSDLNSGEIAKGTVVSAVIGGTASVISGGKFANGARTAAFQYLFNQAGKLVKKSWLGKTRTETKVLSVKDRTVYSSRFSNPTPKTPSRVVGPWRIVQAALMDEYNVQYVTRETQVIQETNYSVWYEDSDGNVTSFVGSTVYDEVISTSFTTDVTIEFVRHRNYFNMPSNPDIVSSQCLSNQMQGC